MANRRRRRSRDDLDRAAQHRRRLGGSEPGPSESRTWRFFKLILPPTLDEKRLCVPRKFTQHFADEIPDVATLVVPTGDTWDIAVSRVKNKLWFSQGWESFAKFYSLNVGNFLLFGYERGSSFTVNVFDITGCEIKYPLCCRATAPEPYQANCVSSDCEEVRRESVSVQCVDLHSDSVQCVELLSDSDAETPAQQSLSNNHNKIDSDYAVYLDEEFPKSVCHDSIGAEFIEGTSGRSLRTMDAMKAAQMVETGNPHFIIEMRKYNTTFLHLPRDFSLKHLRSDMTTLKLRSNGIEWYTECNYRPDICLVKGWVTFWQENNLKVGDVCVFELLDVEHPVMNVTIFR